MLHCASPSTTMVRGWVLLPAPLGVGWARRGTCGAGERKVWFQRAFATCLSNQRRQTPAADAGSRRDKRDKRGTCRCTPGKLDSNVAEERLSYPTFTNSKLDSNRGECNLGTVWRACVGTSNFDADWPTVDSLREPDEPPTLT